MPIVASGSNLDINQLTAYFASKMYVTDLEARINAIEANHKKDINNHEGRIKNLEEGFSKHGDSIADIYSRLGDLQNRPMSAPASVVTVPDDGKIDTDTIMIMI